MVAPLATDWFVSVLRLTEERQGNEQGDPAYGPLQIVCRSVIIYLCRGDNHCSVGKKHKRMRSICRRALNHHEVTRFRFPDHLW